MSYHAIIGMEVHVQLNTKTKLFCRCLNEYTPDDPNKNICVFCTGQPGALPVLNKEAVKKALRFGVAIGATIPDKTRWDRKNYFYPDLPAGYQISQYDNPIVEGGKIEFYIQPDGALPEKRSVNLTRAHLESDAGKLLHIGDKTLVDFNRSGAPLIEIVSEPEIRTSLEAMGYVSELQLLVRTLGISDADMEKGQMRFDCNLSLQTDDEFATGKLPSYKVEIKNINSIRALGRAIEYEIKRQTNLLESGEKPIQETRGWRDDLNKSVGQRSKEDAMDYRYFPEPDLQILEIRRSDLPQFSELGVLPKQKREKYLQLGLNLTISNLFTTQPEVGYLFDQVNDNFNLNSEVLTAVANIISQNLQALALKNERPIGEILTTKQITDLASLFATREISNQGLSKTIELVAGNQNLDINELVDKNNLRQVNDDSVLQTIAHTVLQNNPKPVEEYKSGKIQVIGFLVGQCMKESKGQGNPQKFKAILEDKLSQF